MGSFLCDEVLDIDDLSKIPFQVHVRQHGFFVSRFDGVCLMQLIEADRLICIVLGPIIFTIVVCLQRTYCILIDTISSFSPFECETIGTIKKTLEERDFMA